VEGGDDGWIDRRTGQECLYQASEGVQGGVVAKGEPGADKIARRGRRGPGQAWSTQGGNHGVMPVR
jgi:hypothetical protein